MEDSLGGNSILSLILSSGCGLMIASFGSDFPLGQVNQLPTHFKIIDNLYLGFVELGKD